MDLFASYLLDTLAVLFAIPAIMLVIELTAALVQFTPQGRGQSEINARPRIAVLVPAHNESNGILATLEDIKSQINSDDRLVVIADNCVDDTAAVSAAAGAEVIERKDPSRTGKGYALDFGLEQLRQDPPPVVIIIDADCHVAGGTIDQLAKVCAKTHRPVQAVDLMTAPENSTINHRVAEFAWRVKNWVRPLGLWALNLPCQLMGTGMAFPWEIVTSAHLASGSIVEDLKLGLDLAHIGYPPLFCPSAKVTSHFPSSIAGTQSQRKRWEQGHIHMILTTGPRFIYEAIMRGDLQLFVLTLDLTIPPISLLAILLAAMCSIAGLAAVCGLSSAPLIISASCSVALILAIFLSWLKYGRDVLPTSSTLSIVSYTLSKISIYCQLLSGNVTSSWVRTDRKIK
jgi:cellulose synthase/poly-beta-1,6-N-acetylglucosamine synthase-like glycosyltransferase